MAAENLEIVPLPPIIIKGIKVKDIRFFTNTAGTIEWDQGKCMHSGKCLKNIPYIISKPGVYSINVSDCQFDSILDQTQMCPSGALKMLSPK